MQQVVLSLLIIYCALMEAIHALKPVIKAAVFDLDGTLLGMLLLIPIHIHLLPSFIHSDTEAISTIAIQQVLHRYGKLFTPDMKRRIIGLRGDLWTQLIINEFQLETVLNPTDFVKEWEINMAEYIRVNGVDVLPGGYEIVNEFHSKNVPMAIATSSNSVSVAKKIKNHELLFNKMKFIVCGDDKEVLTHLLTHSLTYLLTHL